MRYFHTDLNVIWVRFHRSGAPTRSSVRAVALAYASVVEDKISPNTLASVGKFLSEFIYKDTISDFVLNGDFTEFGLSLTPAEGQMLFDTLIWLRHAMHEEGLPGGRILYNCNEGGGWFLLPVWKHR